MCPGKGWRNTSDCDKNLSESTSKIPREGREEFESTQQKRNFIKKNFPIKKKWTLGKSTVTTVEQNYQCTEKCKQRRFAQIWRTIETMAGRKENSRNVEIHPGSQYLIYGNSGKTYPRKSVYHFLIVIGIREHFLTLTFFIFQTEAAHPRIC